ncbi:MAG: type II secretion system protein GspG [Planctomycetota bacterium]
MIGTPLDLPSPRRGAQHPSPAFTLIELMVVITIIGLIATIATVSVTGALAEAKRRGALVSMRQILAAAETVFVITGEYPATMDALVEARGPDGEKIGLKERPIDPWGNEFEYALAGGEPRVRCFGSDKAEGGTGSAADLVLPAETAE